MPCEKQPLIAVLVLSDNHNIDLAVENWPEGQPLPQAIVVDYDDDPITPDDDLVHFMHGSEPVTAGCYEITVQCVPNGDPEALIPSQVEAAMLADVCHSQFKRWMGA